MIHEKGTMVEEQETATSLKLMSKKLEALLGEIKYEQDQWKQWAARQESTKQRKVDMECHPFHQKRQFGSECLTTTSTCSRNGQALLSQ